jgi:hypothetical protein
VLQESQEPMCMFARVCLIWVYTLVIVRVRICVYCRARVY